MLVLTRAEGQEIVIRGIDGVEIVVRVESIRGSKVRLSVEAPRALVEVHRREVWEEIREREKKLTTESTEGHGGRTEEDRAGLAPCPSVALRGEVPAGAGP